MYVKLATLCFLVLAPSCTSSDNFVLLSGTLKTMQRAACDDEMVSLACPRGTSISIQVAQYGRAAQNGLCVADVRAADFEVDEEQCLWPNAMQYSLLQTVVEACQKKPDCKFSTKLKPGLVDPCPHARKFVEVAYKCRPYEFRSLTVCEDEGITLSCSPYSRVAVFDARYGRTILETNSCPQTPGVSDETCTGHRVTETVMQMCHGRRRCSFFANSKTFGNPCKPETKTYINVIYACVPLGVLTEKYESAAEQDEVINGKHERDRNDDGFDVSESSGEKWDLNIVSPVADPALQPLPDDDGQASDIVEKQSVYKPPQIREKKPEKSTAKISLFIYIGIGVIIFIVLTIMLIGVRCYIIRKSSRTSKTGEMFTTEAPNVFNDTVSDIDNDIDVSHISGTFYDPIHPDMILYRDVPGSKGTIRAMRPLSTIYPCAGASMYGNVDYVPPREEPSRFKDEDCKPDALSPKSLRTYPNSQFYYG